MKEVCILKKEEKREGEKQREGTICLRSRYCFQEWSRACTNFKYQMALGARKSRHLSIIRMPAVAGAAAGYSRW